MVYQATSHYAPYEPSSQIAMGDYGAMDEASGNFIRYGNILNDHPELEQLLGTPTETKEASRYVSQRTEKEYDVSV